MIPRLKTTIEIIIGLAIIVGGGLWLMQKPRQVAVSPTPTVSVDTTDWKTYQNEYYSFKYPPTLSVMVRDYSVTLMHSVPYYHSDPCNVRYGGYINDLVDFSASLQLLNLNLKDSVKDNDNFLLKYFKGDDLELKPDYIDEFSVGSLKGYSIFDAVEGCGEIIYYFPLSQDYTLRVTQSVTAIIEAGRGVDLPHRFPDIILPEQQNRFFEGILSSFQLI